MRRSVPGWSGYFVLDKAASETVKAHLESLSLAEIATQAAEKLDISYTIVQEPSGALLVRNSSALAEKEKYFVPGVEHLETARDGSLIRQMMEYVSPTVIRVSSDWSKGRVIHTRTLTDGGASIHETIDYTHTSGRRTLTNRVLRRSQPPAPGSKDPDGDD